MRIAPSACPMRMPRSVKAAAPTATSTLVRRPAVRCRYWRSAPIMVPSTKAQTRLKTELRNSPAWKAWMIAIASVPLVREVRAERPHRNPEPIAGPCDGRIAERSGRGLRVRSLARGLRLGDGDLEAAGLESEFFESGLLGSGLLESGILPAAAFTLALRAFAPSAPAARIRAASPASVTASAASCTVNQRHSRSCCSGQVLSCLRTSRRKTWTWHSTVSRLFRRLL